MKGLQVMPGTRSLVRISKQTGDCWELFINQTSTMLFGWRSKHFKTPNVLLTRWNVHLMTQTNFKRAVKMIYSEPPLALFHDCLFMALYTNTHIAPTVICSLTFCASRPAFWHPRLRACGVSLQHRPLPADVTIASSQKYTTDQWATTISIATSHWSALVADKTSPLSIGSPSPNVS